MEDARNDSPIGFRENMQNVLKFLVLIRPYWKNITVFIFSGLVLTLLSLPFPWLTKVMIDDVMLRQDQSLLYVILLSTFILIAVRSLLASLRDYYVAYIQHAMAYDIRLKFFRHLQRLSFSFFDRREVAEILSRLRDASSSRRMLIDIINEMINNLLYLTIVPFIVFLINWKLALIAGVTLPWLAFSFFVFARFVKKYARLSAEKQAEMSAKNYEFLSGIREIQSLGIEGRIIQRAKLIYLQFRKLDMGMRIFGNVQGFFGALMTALGTMLYTWYGATLVINGRMTVGELMAFTTFVGYLYNPLTSTIGLIVPMQQVLVYTRRFYEIYDVRSDIREPKTPLKIKQFKGHVVYSGVSFGYQPDRIALKDISIDVAPGTRVAIVGETGGGKSTLMRLLPRFYDPQEGAITIDSVNVRDMSIADLRSRIGMVFQHPFIFVGTIYDNITCGRRGVKRSRVIEAAKAARAHAFIAALPNGYDTLVGEKGVTLSGGEQQRIALARLFLLNRPILILDEATSNIDQKTEAHFQKIFKRLAQGRTTFIIAHRLSTIKDADVILVMHHGSIVERGSHQELLAKKGVYFRLYHRTTRTALPSQAAHFV